MCGPPDDPHGTAPCAGCRQEIFFEDFEDQEMEYCMNCLDPICPACMDKLGPNNFICPGCKQDYRREQPTLREQANG